MTQRPDDDRYTARPEFYPEPEDLRGELVEQIDDLSFRLSQQSGLYLPWPALHNLLKMQLLPGWLALVGARAKGGKSTFMRGLYRAWTDLGRDVLYVGTEQAGAVLALLMAAENLGIPPHLALDPRCEDHIACREEAKQEARHPMTTGTIQADPDLTLERFAYWIRWADAHDIRVVLLDHFHRLNGHDGQSKLNEQRSREIRHIKNMAEEREILIVAAAQLTHGEGGSLLGEYEVPGPSSWAESASLRRECDLAIQCWRPFKPSITPKQKAEVRDNVDLLDTIIKTNVMHTRIDAARYVRLPAHNLAPLSVTDYGLETFTTAEPPAYLPRRAARDERDRDAAREPDPVAPTAVPTPEPPHA